MLHHHGDTPNPFLATKAPATRMCRRSSWTLLRSESPIRDKNGVPHMHRSDSSASFFLARLKAAAAVAPDRASIAFVPPPLRPPSRLARGETAIHHHIRPPPPPPVARRTWSAPIPVANSRAAAHHAISQWRAAIPTGGPPPSSSSGSHPDHDHLPECESDVWSAADLWRCRSTSPSPMAEEEDGENGTTITIAIRANTTVERAPVLTSELSCNGIEDELVAPSAAEHQ